MATKELPNDNAALLHGQYGTPADWSRLDQLPSLQTWTVLDTCGETMLSNEVIQKFVDAVANYTWSKYSRTVSTKPRLERCKGDVADLEENLRRIMALKPQICLITLSTRPTPLFDVVHQVAHSVNIPTQCVLARNVSRFTPDIVETFCAQITRKVWQNVNLTVTLAKADENTNVDEISAQLASMNLQKPKFIEPMSLSRLKSLLLPSVAPEKVIAILIADRNGFAQLLNDPELIETAIEEAIQRGRVFNWPILTVATKAFNAESVVFRQRLSTQLCQSGFLREAVPKALQTYYDQFVYLSNVTAIDIVANLNSLTSALTAILSCSPDESANLTPIADSLFKLVPFIQKGRLKQLLSDEFLRLYEDFKQRWDELNTKVEAEKAED